MVLDCSGSYTSLHFSLLAREGYSNKCMGMIYGRMYRDVPAREERHITSLSPGLFLAADPPIFRFPLTGPYPFLIVQGVQIVVTKLRLSPLFMRCAVTSNTKWVWQQQFPPSSRLFLLMSWLAGLGSGQRKWLAGRSLGQLGVWLLDDMSTIHPFARIDSPLAHSPITYNDEL